MGRTKRRRKKRKKKMMRTKAESHNRRKKLGDKEDLDVDVKEGDANRRFTFIIAVMQIM